MSRDAVVAEGGEIMVSEDSTLSVVAEKRAALSSLIALALPWMRALVVKAAVVEADNATARVAAAAARMCCFVILEFMFPCVYQSQSQTQKLILCQDLMIETRTWIVQNWLLDEIGRKESVTRNVTNKRYSPPGGVFPPTNLEFQVPSCHACGRCIPLH